MFLADQPCSLTKVTESQCFLAMPTAFDLGRPMKVTHEGRGMFLLSNNAPQL